MHSYFPRLCPSLTVVVADGDGLILDPSIHVLPECHPSGRFCELVVPETVLSEMYFAWISVFSLSFVCK